MGMSIERHRIAAATVRAIVSGAKAKAPSLTTSSEPGPIVPLKWLKSQIQCTRIGATTPREARRQRYAA
jgi:hypothetical protein